MDKRETFLQYAKQIKDLGYTVYINDDDDYNYGYIVNENNQICYFQLSSFFGLIDLSTVHMPSQSIGSGFSMYKGISPTKELINECFCTGPAWASPYFRDVKKYESWNHYNSFKLNSICKTIKL